MSFEFMPEDAKEFGIEDKVAARLEAKAPYKTYWIALNYPEAQVPTALIAALEAAGWQKDSFAPASPLFGRQTVSYNKPGSGLFNAWSDAERRKFKREATLILSQHGAVLFQDAKLTFADLI